MEQHLGCYTLPGGLGIDSDDDRGSGLGVRSGYVYSLGFEHPLLIGGLVSWYVGTRSKDENVNKARRERGTLIASGFIAGGALMGVISAILKYCGADWFMTWSGAEILAVVMYILIILYFIYDSMKAKNIE